MRDDFASTLQKTLERMGWPSKELKLTDNLVGEWTDQVETMLDLQEPYDA